MEMDITVASMMNPYPVLDGNGNPRVNNDDTPYMRDLREMYIKLMQMEREQLRHRLEFETNAICDMAYAEQELQQYDIDNLDEMSMQEQSLDFPIDIESITITDNKTPVMSLTMTMSHSSIDGQKQIGKERNDSSWGNWVKLVSYILGGIGLAYVGASFRMDFMM